LISQPR